MFGIKQFATTNLDGFWGLVLHRFFRLPVVVVFILLSGSFVFCPAQKNLATLMSCCAANIDATQFWHSFGGGLYLALFLPMVMLAIFRPNLDDCIALEVVRPMRRERTDKSRSIEKAETGLAATLGRRVARSVSP